MGLCLVRAAGGRDTQHSYGEGLLCSAAFWASSCRAACCIPGAMHGHGTEHPPPPAPPPPAPCHAMCLGSSVWWQAHGITQPLVGEDPSVGEGYGELYQGASNGAHAWAPRSAPRGMFLFLVRGCVDVLLLEGLNYRPLAAFSQCVVLIGASTRLFGSSLCRLQLGQGDERGAAWAALGTLHALPCCPMALCSLGHGSAMG